MTRTGAALISVVIGLVPIIVQAENSLTTAQAKEHMGQSATVCGDVVSTRYASKSRGNPTFINLDKPYPNQIFTVLIWGSDRPKFGNPEEKYGSKHICVTGRITEYRGVPEVAAYDPSQVRIQ
jgi:hypothetical protein